MSQSSHTIIKIDPAKASYQEILACCDICNSTWPSQGGSAEGSAESILQRQKDGDFSTGTEQWFVIKNGDLVIAHASSFPRKMTVDGYPMTLLALGGVCTRPEQRKLGLGSAVVKACFNRVDQGEFPYCLFQTSHKNRHFYERLGCVLIDNRIVNSLAKDPEANPFWDEIVMVYPAKPSFPKGTVDLLGPGF